MKLSLAILAALAISAFAGPVEDTQRSLQDDLREFVALIPVDKIKETFYAYLEQDLDFQAAIDYLGSEEFTSLLYEVETMPEVKKFLDHLEELGVPVWKYVNILNNELGLQPVYRVLATRLDPPGVKGFLQVVGKLIPREKLEALYKHKLETSKEFKELVDHLKSPASQEFADKMMKHPKFQKFMAMAEEHGVNVQEVLDYLSSMFGLKFPHRPNSFLLREHVADLVMDLKEFTALVPHKQIHALAKEYYSKDVAFQDAINWLDTDKVLEHFAKVESVEEFKHFLNYLEEAGFPAYDFVNGFNHAAGLPSVHPRQSEDLGGFSGYLQGVYKLVPHEAVHKLYLQKMEHSPAYKKFVVAMNSPQASEVFHHLADHEYFQAFVQEAMEHGVNYKEVLDLVGYMYGINHYHHKVELRNEKTLGEELKDFENLVPKDKINNLFYEYMENDNEFQQLVDYVASEEFRDLLLDVESMDRVKSFMKYLDEHQVPVYEYMNALHKQLGMDPMVPAKMLKDDYYGGVKGFFKAVRKLVPQKEMVALYEEKVKSSKVFAEFVQKLQSKETQDMVNDIMNNPHVVKFMEQLKKWDVNFREVLDLVTQLVGVRFPMNY